MNFHRCIFTRYMWNIFSYSILKAPSLEATSCQINVHFSLVKILFAILKHTSFDFLCKIDASTSSQEDILGVTYDFFFGKSLLQNNN